MDRSVTQTSALLGSDVSVMNMVWVPDDREGYILATRIEEQGENCVVELQESGKKIVIPKDSVQRVNPPKYDGVADMSTLIYMNEASVFNNLKCRYYQGQIYTYSGLFCVVVNPYRNYPLYDNPVIDLYRGKRRHELPPHIFAVTDEAYRNMLQNKEDQSILCTGESGAGKTENTKRIVQYLAMVAVSNKKQNQALGSVTQHSEELEKRLLVANPILEAFGNAKTIKNDNSSRFGKFIRIGFNYCGNISGACVETYLLEKARVVLQAADERSFHIFYHLLSLPERRKKYLLGKEDSYRFLTNGMMEIPGVKENDAFLDITRAMSVLGILPEEQETIFSVVSSVLILGQLDFQQERNSDQATLPDFSTAEVFSHLLEVSPTEMVKSLLKPRLKVGKEFVLKAQNKEQAESGVKAIAKALYDRLFRWLVERMNKCLNRVKCSGERFIGILDIAGFEIFQINSFEQLCINYTNEKLQQLFNHIMFIVEQQEYQREGIAWDHIDFGIDSQQTIDLIERRTGILSILDEESYFPKATDKSFVDKLLKTHEKNPKFCKPEFRSPAHFAVIHYAGRVEYTVVDWLIKNRDPINESTVCLLQASNNQYIQAMWKDADMVGMAASTEGTFGSIHSVRRGMLCTTSLIHKTSLLNLMNVLDNTTHSFVRCVMPNHEKKAGRIDAIIVICQLRCNGVLEGIRIFRRGYPRRLTFLDFRQQFEILTPGLIPKGFMDSKKSAMEMLKALDLSQDVYRIGHSKIFFKSGVLAQLEDDRNMYIRNIISILQARIRGHLARRQRDERCRGIQAMTILQRNFDAYLKLSKWPWWRLINKIRPLLQVTRQEDLVARKEEELRKVQEQMEKVNCNLADMQRTQELLNNEKMQLFNELQQEHDVNQSLQVERDRLCDRLNALEADFNELEVKTNEERVKMSSLETEQKRLSQQVSDLSDQLESEEHQRQKLQVEKTTLEHKLSQLNDDFVSVDDKYNKLMKDKKQLNERIELLTNQLSEEEERSKHLTKLKAKYESNLTDLQDKLSREHKCRQDIEMAKRRLEAEANERSEQASESSRLVDELRATVSKLETELLQLQNKLDQEIVNKTMADKRIRECESLIQELSEDLEIERAAHKAAEETKRDLLEEVEAMRSELVDSGTNNEAQTQALRKFETEMSGLRNQLEAQSTAHENTVQEMRKKHAIAIESLNEQIEQLKKAKSSLDRTKTQQEAAIGELQKHLQSARSDKTELEKRRRQVEQQLNESLMKIQELDIQRNDLEGRLTKQINEIDGLNNSTEELEAKLTRLMRSESSLQCELNDLRTRLDEETREKLTLQSQLRQLGDEHEALKDGLETEEEAKATLEKHILTLNQQIHESKRKVNEDVAQLENLEDMRKKLLRELDDTKNRNEELLSQVEKLDKSRRKLQSELEDMNHVMASQRSDQANNERRIKKLESANSELLNKLTVLQNEKDSFDRELRDRETKLLTQRNELDDLQEQLEESERKQQTLSKDLQELGSNRDDAGKSLLSLEQAKINLANELSMAQGRIEELEDEVSTVTLYKQRVEVQMNALRTQQEHALSSLNQNIEEQRRQAQKRIQELETELLDEQRERASHLAVRKKLESDFNDLNQRFDSVVRQRDDTLKHLKRCQNINASTQRELDDALCAREQALESVRDLDKKCRSLENEKVCLQEDLSASERSARSLRGELDEALSEISTATSCKINAIDEKKRLEGHITTLEDQLEELQSTVDATEERYKRTLSQLEQVQADLSSERNNMMRTESQRSSLEKHVKELRDRLVEAEKESNRRSKAQIATLEARLAAYDEQLEAEKIEKMNANKNLRRSEKKIRDILFQNEELKRNAELIKESYDSAQAAVKLNKQILAKLEEDHSLLLTRHRRLQRERDELKNDRPSIEAGSMRNFNRLNRRQVPSNISVRPGDEPLFDDNVDSGLADFTHDGTVTTNNNADDSN